MSDSLRGCDLYWDCFAGIAGDMALGALLDLGVPETVVHAALAQLPVGGYRLERTRVQRGALMGTKIDVVDVVIRHAPEHHHHHQHDHGDDHQHDHRHYREIRALLARLDADVQARATAIFDRIAAIEARLHGVTVDEVAFHEVGAVDSIVDIVGTAAALAWLAPARVTSRRVPLGGGTVDTAHGRLPVPAPATLELLAGAEVEADGDSELTTPTGAAIVAATATAYGPLPPGRVLAVGWGAGTRQLADRPNLLRVVATQRAAVADVAAGEVIVLEANVDDMNPEFCEPLLEALFAAGALDAWLQPMVMKKGRPALLVGALCEPARREAVTAALLAESTTLGVRWRAEARTVLPRRSVEVETSYGTVAVKVAGPSAAPLNVAPEYESCRQRAREHGVPIKLVYQAAIAAFHRR